MNMNNLEIPIINEHSITKDWINTLDHKTLTRVNGWFEPDVNKMILRRLREMKLKELNIKKGS